MVPALLNDSYIIRFAVCSPYATPDDIYYAWYVISEIANDVIAVCETSTADNEADLDGVIASLAEKFEKMTPPSGGSCLMVDDTSSENGDDHAHLYDDNIPSLASIETLHAENEAGVDVQSKRRQLMRMMSDPRSRNTTIVSAVAHNAQRRHSESENSSAPSSSRFSDIVETVEVVHGPR